MNCNTTDPADGVDRRSVLAAGAAGLSLSLSGCIDSVRSVVTDNEDDPLSLSIVTVPDDYSRETMRIARHLESNLQAIGIDAGIEMRSQSDFLEMVLLDHDFDLYVGNHPADFDPDFLYEALHSTYADESGWQNPFGYDNPTFFDPLLEEQRHADGDDREEKIEALFEALVSEKPFETICRANEYRVARDDRFSGWGENHLGTRYGFLGLEQVGDADRLEALVTDAGLSRNVNPLSATNRERNTVIDLLYDSLGTVDDGSVEPWLADEWVVDEDDEDDEQTTLTVRLREDCTFHPRNDEEADDPVRVTPEDVQFTYEFLNDTSYTLADNPSPAPRYRGHASAVMEVDPDHGDDYEFQITFDAGREVAERALTAPILPRHIWLEEELNDRVNDRTDFSPAQGKWGIVTSSSIDPVGSGPYQFESRSNGDHLTLERFDDHFTLREDVDLPEPTAEEIRFTVDTGSVSSIQRVASGGADVTESVLEASSLGEFPEDNEEIERHEDESWTFYHVGFNTRSRPCSSPRFRNAVAQLIDKEWIVDEVFYESHAEPLAVPVSSDWEENLELPDPETTFVGSDGEPNVNEARNIFEEIGYQYHEEEDRLR
ncbi:ABC transporter substrate-binding protein [Natronorubrum sp. DTA7]|uniref:ABC transporter substrate-binding protein n=1 Tax=Natronorubrum sp. DTA7 TaxID=3447016 RepID=UPI003F86199C